jgi:hypothetical protein
VLRNSLTVAMMACCVNPRKQSWTNHSLFEGGSQQLFEVFQQQTKHTSHVVFSELNKLKGYQRVTESNLLHIVGRRSSFPIRGYQTVHSCIKCIALNNELSSRLTSRTDSETKRLRTLLGCQRTTRLTFANEAMHSSLEGL